MRRYLPAKMDASGGTDSEPEVIDMTDMDKENNVVAPMWWGGGPVPKLEDLKPNLRVFESLQAK
jgi:hypothetical protein